MSTIRIYLSKQSHPKNADKHFNLKNPSNVSAKTLCLTILHSDSAKLVLPTSKMPSISSLHSYLSIHPVYIALALIFVTSISPLDAVNNNGFSAKNVIDSRLLTQKIGTNRTITVDISGKGDFKSVQAAIDSVPEGNSNWIVVHLRKGVYREKVYIPPNKPYIFLRGNGKGKSAIVWSHSSVDNYESATFKVEAPNFIAFGISFKNEAPTGIAYTSQNQSVAALVGADKAAFYHCAFFSTHNTLFDYKGRHYYDACYIQGSIDFIFGRAQSIFHVSAAHFNIQLRTPFSVSGLHLCYKIENLATPHALVEYQCIKSKSTKNLKQLNCELFVIGDKRIEIRGSVTAQNRHNASENSGFVFIKGKVYGIGDVHLGRAKGAHSRVVFANTYLSNTIVPQGWTNWSYAGNTENLYQAEYKCHGPGSASNNRAPWSKQLSDKEAAPFLSIDFINGKEWLPAWL
ncbi:unnamed protein product [Ilex paraguariensis]|uniref:Pectinesterase n=1 Tax=Ilex paraguariensis TaxID=185542 RepID=A0ABC8RA00_9AQUA